MTHLHIPLALAACLLFTSCGEAVEAGGSAPSEAVEAGGSAPSEVINREWVVIEMTGFDTSVSVENASVEFTDGPEQRSSIAVVNFCGVGGTLGTEWATDGLSFTLVDAPTGEAGYDIDDAECKEPDDLLTFLVIDSEAISIEVEGDLLTLTHPMRSLVLSAQSS